MTTMDERRANLQAIADEIKICTCCKLHEERTNAVPGTGPANADVFFLGEGPGAQEDQLRLPFVGRSGQFLDELLHSIGLNCEKVFITNVVKCRPPGNRDPHVREIRACTTYLKRQLDLIRPALIATLGRFAMRQFLSDGPISEIHSQPRRIDETIILPLYHPAAALYRGSLRSVVKEDFQRTPELLETLGRVSEPPSSL
jgi:uracil-DNA glycosylase family 4